MQTAAPLIVRAEQAEPSTDATEAAASDPEATAASPEPAVDPCVPVVLYTDADLAFMDTVLGQHERGTEIADAAFAAHAGAAPEVVDFAQRLLDRQDADAASFDELLVQWGATAEPDAPQLTPADESVMRLLEVMTGFDFDRLWLRVAAGHLLHVAGVADAEQRAGTSEEAITAARQLRDSAMDEAMAMVELLRSLPAG
jgi:uncharacterized protein (DUF305 family)